MTDESVNVKMPNAMTAKPHYDAKDAYRDYVAAMREKYAEELQLVYARIREAAAARKPSLDYLVYGNELKTGLCEFLTLPDMGYKVTSINVDPRREQHSLHISWRKE